MVRSSARVRAVPAIFVGGVIVGLIDFLYAVVVYSPRHPVLIAQGIASGALGPKSYSEGAYSALLGVFFHFLIALGAATVYFVSSRRLRFLIDHPVASGIAYGALVFLFMHLVVLPLSAFPKGEFHPVYVAFEFVEHWFGVGLPIALSVRHYSR